MLRALTALFLAGWLCVLSAPLSRAEEAPALASDTAPETTGHLRRVDYEGFSVWIDCGLRSPVVFHYVLAADTGNLPRHAGYEIDPDVDAACQPLSDGRFQPHVPDGAPAYDVGHQAPANHFDGSAQAIRETNFWTNLLPQTASMNRGAWLRTEYIIDCLRDETPVEVWGGAVWAGNAEDDHFMDSHGVRTPSAFWKVAIRTDTREAQAWLIPNGSAPASSLDDWLQPVVLIETLTAMEFEVADRLTRPHESWSYRSDCTS